VHIKSLWDELGVVDPLVWVVMQLLEVDDKVVSWVVSNAINLNLLGGFHHT
jgi:hypothetical protein